jgi:hypothetical protein
VQQRTAHLRDIEKVKRMRAQQHATKLWILATVAVAILALSAGTAVAVEQPATRELDLAAGEFADVPDEHIFVDDIAWMAAADVTRGCNPPSNDRYCPSEFVTRGQMAAFMHRLATSRAVDAGWLEGYRWEDLFAGDIAGDGGSDDSGGSDGRDGSDGSDGSDFDGSGYLAVDAKAADSDKLDGLDSTDFVRTGTQVVDSDTLDGKDSSDFLGSQVTTRSQVLNLTAGVVNSHQVMCTGSEIAVSGGYEGTGIPGGASIEVLGNHPDGNGWSVEAELSANGSITVYAQCMAIG